MTDFLERWANKDPENAKLVAEEWFITEVTEVVWASMEQAGVSKSELARRLGTSKGHITQLLGGSRNMTLRTLADICHVLEMRPSLRILPRRVQEEAEEPRLNSPATRNVQYLVVQDQRLWITESRPPNHTRLQYNKPSHSVDQTSIEESVAA